MADANVTTVTHIHPDKLNEINRSLEQLKVIASKAFVAGELGALIVDSTIESGFEGVGKYVDTLSEAIAHLGKSASYEIHSEIERLEHSLNKIGIRG